MKNDYEIRGDVTAIFINHKKFGNVEALISTNKLERVMEFPNLWTVSKHKKRNSLYAHGRLYAQHKEKYVSLHGWITNAPTGKEVDHRNHNTLNNTDDNLRIVTVSENQQNRNGANSCSSSGIRGVHWHKGSQKWNVQLRISGVKMCFGAFDDIKDAEIVAITARREHMPFSQEAMQAK